MYVFPRNRACSLIFALFALTIALGSGNSFAEGGRSAHLGQFYAKDAEDSNEWIDLRLEPTDQLLCLLQSGHNWFFIARSENRVKTGALIDVTNEAGDTLSYVMSWEFRDGNGKHIGEPRPRDVQVSRHFEQLGRVFAEEVVYRHVTWASSFEADVGLAYLSAATKVDKAQIQANPPPIVASCKVQVPATSN